MIATRPPSPWAVGDRRIVAELHPPVEVATIATGAGLGLAGVAMLWWLDLPALAALALLALAVAISACFRLPLDHLAVGSTWVANGPPGRPRILHAHEVRSVEMPELLDLGLPVLKLLGPTRTVRVDVDALHRRPPLAVALLDVIDQALAHGATLDRDAAQTLSSLRRPDRRSEPR